MTPFPGMDMNSLQALMQQFAPSDEEKRQARGFAALQAAAGLLGTRKGFEGQGVGNAIQGGLLGYNQQLRNVSDERIRSAQGAGSMLALQNQLQQYNDAQTMRGLAGQYLRPAQPGMPEMGPPTDAGQMQPPVPPTPARQDWQGYQAALTGMGPQGVSMASQIDPFVRRQMMRDAQLKVNAPQVSTGAGNYGATSEPMPPTQSVTPPTVGQSAPSGPPSVPATKGNATQQYVAQQQALEQAYRSSGLFDEADAIASRLVTMLPKSKAENVVGKDAKGNPTYVSIDDQGNSTQTGITPADKAHFVDAGGYTFAADPYTGKPIGAPIGKTQTPDSKASNALGYAHLAETQRHNQMVEGDPATIEQTAQAIAAGKLQPLTGFALARPMGQAVMARVTQINPDFDPTKFQTNQKAEKDFATGKQGNSVRSFNVALTHLDTLGNLAEAMHNGDVKVVNTLANFYKDQTGQTAPNNFNAAKQIVADEITKAIIGSGGGVGDRQKAQDTVNAANSPQQLAGVITTYKELMKGQLGGLRQQYEQSTGKTDFDKYLSGQAKSVAGGTSGGLPPDIADILKKHGTR